MVQNSWPSILRKKQSLLQTSPISCKYELMYADSNALKQDLYFAKYLRHFVPNRKEHSCFPLHILLQLFIYSLLYSPSSFLPSSSYVFLLIILVFKYENHQIRKETQRIFMFFFSLCHQSPLILISVLFLYNQIWFKK